MPNAAYRDGRKLEYAAHHLLTDNGYIMFRTAGSHGKADLIAFKPGEILLIQCKLDGEMGPADRADLVKMAALVDAVPLVAYWHKEGRAARTVRFYRITYMSRTRVPWTPDHALQMEAP